MVVTEQRLVCEYCDETFQSTLAAMRCERTHEIQDAAGATPRVGNDNQLSYTPSIEPPGSKIWETEA